MNINISRNIHQLSCFPLRITQKFAQFELQRAPDSVINIFLNWDKCTFELIINDYKTMKGSSEISFLSLLTFNNVFFHKKYLKNETQVEKSLARFSSQNSDFEVATRSF